MELKSMEGITLNVSEIFYSLQGEGARAGTANVFIRLQGCKAQHACAAMGIKCDTEFESGRSYTLDQLYANVVDISSGTGCNAIIWTGGEPADQLTDEIVEHFSARGWFQAIETSGLKPVPQGLDYVVVSPKVAEHIVAKNFDHVQELRYVRHAGQDIPKPKITADRYFISPHSDGFTINTQNLNHCIELAKKNATWSLSLQLHKIWNVL